MDFNITTCSEFSLLAQIYSIGYICYNYNIFCDNYCAYDSLADCYCYCDNNQIYCYSRYYYYSRFISVLFVALLFAMFCSCICTYFKNKKINQKVNNDKPINTDDYKPPTYDELKK
jgi:hypothetical protein